MWNHHVKPDPGSIYGFWSVLEMFTFPWTPGRDSPANPAEDQERPNIRNSRIFGAASSGQSVRCWQVAPKPRSVPRSLDRLACPSKEKIGRSGGGGIPVRRVLSILAALCLEFGHQTLHGWRPIGPPESGNC